MNWYSRHHIEDIKKADLRYPIFVTEEYDIVDGAHRTAKAYLQGKPIEAIVLTPEELDVAIIDPERNYRGQVYVDEKDNVYAVTEIQKKFSGKPTVKLDPEKLLERNKDCWGDEKIMDIIAEMEKDELV